MIKTSTKTKPPKGGNGKHDKPEMFWRKPTHAELDRAGDFILENLEGIREEATVRGDPG